MNDILLSDAEFITSYELAKLTGLIHRDIKRCMTAFQKRGEISFSRTQEVIETNNGGYKQIESYVLSKQHTFIIVLHLNPKARNELAKYWHDKAREQNGASDDFEEPYDETFADRFENNHQTFSVRQVATTLNACERKFTKFLIDHKYAYRLKRKSNPLHPCKHRVKTGVMVSAPFAVTGCSGLQCRFTAKGVIKVSEDWNEHVRGDPALPPPPRPMHGLIGKQQNLFESRS